VVRRVVACSVLIISTMQVPRRVEGDVRFLFADCVLDTGRRELTRGSDPVAVGPQVFDLLVYLVQNRDRMVSKDDLLETVWMGRVVSESTLSSHINAVRRAVGDLGSDQRLIRTIARKGFRFVGEVREEPPSSAAASAQSAVNPDLAESQEPPKLSPPEQAINSGAAVREPEPRP
jgi:DNA-binding winged helix-turn-helix (wHTH) protein